ncbi:hypothetical protein EDD21DRAFT_294898, partial [Dissophora ornata]
ETPQRRVYDECAKELVERFIEGFNVTILAYGQTGSGKTYSMGTGLQYKDGDQAIVPRAAAAIFTLLNAQMEKDPAMEYQVYVSFLELYNEELIDLLQTQPRTRKDTIQVREDGFGGISWQGVKEQQVTSAQELLDWLQKGSLCRTTAATDMNQTSSRSHAIFSVILKQQRSEELEPKLASKFHFVDLAGSERLKRTRAVGDRAKEGISINAGLLALGNVISALGDEARRSSHIPYRDSKLTRLLQDSLGGNSATLMLACVSAADADINETVSTLVYANRARNIRNRVVINHDYKDASSAEVAHLRAEINRLKMENSAFRAMGSGPATELDQRRAAEEMRSLRGEVTRLRERLRESSSELCDVLAERDTLLVEREVTGDANIEAHPIMMTYHRTVMQLKDRLIAAEDQALELQTLLSQKPNNSLASAMNAMQRFNFPSTASDPQQINQQHQQSRLAAAILQQKAAAIALPDSDAGSLLETASIRTSSSKRSNPKSFSESRSLRSSGGSIENPFDRPLERHLENPFTRAQEKRMENPFEKPLEKHLENPFEKRLEKHLENPFEKPLEKHLENPFEKSLEKHLVNPFDKISERHIENPFDKISEGHIENPFDKISEGHIENPFDKISERHIENPFDKVSVKSSEKHVEKPNYDNMLHEVQSGLAMKEELVNQLERAEYDYHNMRNQYEDEIRAMEDRIRETEMDRERDNKARRWMHLINALIDVASMTFYGIKQLPGSVKVKYETKIKQLMAELSDLQHKYADVSKVANEKRNSAENQLKTLRVAVETLKTEKQRMIKRMKEDAERIKEMNAAQDREIQALRRAEKAAQDGRKKAEREIELQLQQQQRTTAMLHRTNSNGSTQQAKVNGFLKKPQTPKGITKAPKRPPRLGPSERTDSKGSAIPAPKPRNPAIRSQVSQKKQVIDRAIYGYISGQHAIDVMEDMLKKRERLKTEKLELEQERQRIVQAQEENAIANGTIVLDFASEPQYMDDRLGMIDAEVAYVNARIRALQAEAAALGFVTAIERTNHQDEDRATASDDEELMTKLIRQGMANDAMGLPPGSGAAVAFDSSVSILRSLELNESREFLEMLFEDMVSVRSHENVLLVQVGNQEKVIEELKRALQAMRQAAVGTAVGYEKRCDGLEQKLRQLGGSSDDLAILDNKAKRSSTIFDQMYEDAIK